MLAVVKVGENQHGLRCLSRLRLIARIGRPQDQGEGRLGLGLVHLDLGWALAFGSDVLAMPTPFPSLTPRARFNFAAKSVGMLGENKPMSPHKGRPRRLVKNASTARARHHAA